MLLTILNIISIMLLLYGVYYLAMSIFAFLKIKKNIRLQNNKKNKFKILIACRNEEKVIDKLLSSLQKQDYPKELYEVCVIPNNCTDKTEIIARDMKARIITCKEFASCKGDALRGAFKELKKEDFDAYAVFDADNIVHPKFLSKMNEALLMGYKVAQGNRDSKNPSDSVISGSYALYYWIQNLFFNKSRMNINSSSTINGTGYIIKKEIIDKYGFNTKTLTEDIEFTAQCALNNINIAYVEDAITYDEQPVDFKTSWKQRKRWSMGANKCLKIYGLKLIRNLFKTKRIINVDLVFNFMSPFIQVFSTFIMIILFILKVYMQIELAPLTILSFLRITGIHFGIISYVINIIVNIYVVYYNKKDITKLLKGTLFFPIFILTWLPINFVSIFTKKEKWEEIKHIRDINIEDMKITK